MTRSGSSAPSAAISADAAGSAPNGKEDARPRRDFLHLAAGTAVAVGTAASLWPFIDSMNPSRDLLALKTVELDLDAIEPGQRVMLEWRRQPLFVNHRTPEEIARAKADDAAKLIDPEPDAARVQRDEWLVVVGVCTHLGCVPLGQRAGAPRGPWAGWFCPCHGSAYDTSGRVRRGPAPKNLRVPPYRFLDDGVLMVG